MCVQVLSLSIENCLKPKYEYLVNELNGGPHTVTSFPAYFSLSLEQRIKPRHRYLSALKRLPKGPFPMKSLAVTDSCFCKQFADTTIEEYQAFRNELLLSNFAKQFEWKNKVQIWQVGCCSGIFSWNGVALKAVCVLGFQGTWDLHSLQNLSTVSTDLHCQDYIIYNQFLVMSHCRSSFWLVERRGVISCNQGFPLPMSPALMLNIFILFVETSCTSSTYLTVDSIATISFDRLM